MTEREAWKLECFRNTAVHLTMVLEDAFAEVAMLLSYEARTSGFDSVRKMRSARDAMMKFIDVLDGVENLEVSRRKDDVDQPGRTSVEEDRRREHADVPASREI